MKPPKAEEKALALLGFAAKAGRITVGVPLTCEALKRAARDKTPLLVLLAEDASANTKKRITDRTAFYGVPLLSLTADGAALAAAIGKKEGSVAAVGITEPHLAVAVRARLAELENNR